MEPDRAAPPPDLDEFEHVIEQLARVHEVLVAVRSADLALVDAWLTPARRTALLEETTAASQGVLASSLGTAYALSYVSHPKRPGVNPLLSPLSTHLDRAVALAGALRLLGDRARAEALTTPLEELAGLLASIHSQRSYRELVSSLLDGWVGPIADLRIVATQAGYDGVLDYPYPDIPSACS